MKTKPIIILILQAVWTIAGIMILQNKIVFSSGIELLCSEYLNREFGYFIYVFRGCVFPILLWCFALWGIGFSFFTVPKVVFKAGKSFIKGFLKAIYIVYCVIFLLIASYTTMLYKELAFKGVYEWQAVFFIWLFLGAVALAPAVIYYRLDKNGLKSFFIFIFLSFVCVAVLTVVISSIVYYDKVAMLLAAIAIVLLIMFLYCSGGGGGNSYKVTTPDGETYDIEVK